jgi:hypothetical protein
MVPVGVEPLEPDALRLHVADGRIAGAIERECGGLAVDDAEPETRLVQRARKIVHEKSVPLPRLLAERGEGHELRESFELDARGELAAEISLEILEEIFDEEFERRRVGPVRSSRGIARQRRQAAKRADFFGATPQPLDCASLRAPCGWSQVGGIANQTPVP